MADIPRRYNQSDLCEDTHNTQTYDQGSYSGLQVVPQEQDHAAHQTAAVTDEKQYLSTTSGWAHGAEGKNDFAERNQANLEVVVPQKRKKMWKWVVAAMIVLVLAAVAVVVAVMVTRKNQNQDQNIQNSSPATTTGSPSSPTAIPGSTNPSPTGTPFFSASGAYNGTGIAITNPMNSNDAAWVFFQDYKGALKYSALDESGNWGSSMPLGVTGAANATSLAAITYQPSGLTVCHVFWADRTGTIQDVLYTNVSKSWFAGNISAQGWQVPLDSNDAMNVLWSSVLGKVRNVGGGLRLYAGGLDGLIHEYAYDQVTSTWDAGFTFDGTSGFSGAAPMQAGGLTTLHLLNQNNKLEFWWRDAGQDLVVYPSGVWNKGVDAPFTVGVNSSVTACPGDGHVYYLDADNTINSASWAGARESELWNQTSPVNGAVASSGSSLASLFLTLEGVATGSTHLLFQSKGSDIVEYSGIVGSFQSVGTIPV
ncbi:hypothetical protein MMC13_007792 [Lambiella insularis]|nr:hypothetical protein [Lambiella insularis]